MKEDYKELIEKGFLKKEEIGIDKIIKVLEKSQRNLKSAKILLESNEDDIAFELSYESILSAGRALVFSFGLRPRVQGSHKTVIEFLRGASEFLEKIMKIVQEKNPQKKLF